MAEGPAVPKINKIVSVVKPMGFYRARVSVPSEGEGEKRLGGYLYKGKNWSAVRSTGVMGWIRRVPTTTFCDILRCPSLAVWRIGYGTQTVDFCTRHTLSTMRDVELWLGRI